MGYKKLSCAQQVLYVLARVLGKLCKKQFAWFYGKPAVSSVKYVETTNNTNC